LIGIEPVRCLSDDDKVSVAIGQGKGFRRTHNHWNMRGVRGACDTSLQLDQLQRRFIRGR